MKRQAVKGCAASEAWLSAGLEGFTKRAFTVGSGHPSGSTPGAGALLQRFSCCLQSCLMSLGVGAVARLDSSFSDGLLFFRPGLPKVPPTDAWVVPPVPRRLRAVC